MEWGRQVVDTGVTSSIVVMPLLLQSLCPVPVNPMLTQNVYDSQQNAGDPSAPVSMVVWQRKWWRVWKLPAWSAHPSLSSFYLEPQQ